MTRSTEMDADRARSGFEDAAARILKVNHAGENGAIHIYAGQIFCARLTAPHMIPELLGYKADEERHRALFGDELQRRQRPRCRSYWLCGIGGYLLGLFTGLLGARAIAATTVAVERVVLGHLQQQIVYLAGKDEAAVSAIQSIIAEEQQHHDQSSAHARGESRWTAALSAIVAGATESVIWIGMRV